MRASLIFELAKRDFTERYSGSLLGAAWNFIMPAVMIFIYTIIFSRVMGAKMPGISSAYSFGIYLIAGILPWNAFANTLNRSAGVFTDKKNIISKMPVSLATLPLYIVISECITLFIGFAIYISLLYGLGVGLNRFVLLLPFIVAVQQVFAYALGLLLATLSVFLRDLREAANVVTQIWFWFTPIVYMPSILPESFADFLFLNPAYYFTHAYQDIFFHGIAPNMSFLLYLTFLGHGMLFFSLWALRRLEKDVRDFI
ncbi:MAG: ABC transporter permease [Synergistaceae bacterium]|nr:ABC transporter permease [Synergistaceae bacterium]